MMNINTCNFMYKHRKLTFVKTKQSKCNNKFTSLGEVVDYMQLTEFGLRYKQRIVKQSLLANESGEQVWSNDRPEDNKI